MTTARAALKRDTVSGEALFILKNLRDNSKQGRSNKLAEVKTALEPAVSLEFDAYFFFLRKFHYIAMDREAQLKLTDSGERVVDGADLDRFSGEVGEFFSEQLAPVDEPMTDGSLPFETADSADDLTVETADLSPTPAPPPPLPVRYAAPPPPLPPPIPAPTSTAGIPAARPSAEVRSARCTGASTWRSAPRSASRS